KAREMTRLAALRARYEFEQGNYRGGGGDVVAASTLARRVGAGFSLICLMLQYAMGRALVGVTGHYLPRMDGATLKHLASGLAALPPGGSLQRSVPAEKQLLISWLSKVLKEGEERNWKEALLKVVGPESKEGQGALQAALQTAGALTPKWKA